MLSFAVTCNRFLFKDQYIEFTTSIPEDADLYGMGEVTLPTGFLLPRNGRTLTLWARDFPCAFPDVNLYGSHPFYLQVNKGEGMFVSPLSWHRHSSCKYLCMGLEAQAAAVHRPVCSLLSSCCRLGMPHVQQQKYGGLTACTVCHCLMNADGSSHGVLLLNSNGMDVTLNPTSINYK